MFCDSDSLLSSLQLKANDLPKETYFSFKNSTQ